MTWYDSGKRWWKIRRIEGRTRWYAAEWSTARRQTG